MNGKDLLIGLGDIGEKYYAEAEQNIVDSKNRRQVRRPLLTAAVIALTLMLVGCGMVYALRLQDLSIGKEPYTMHYDESGKAIESVEKTKDILTLFGHSDEKVQKALAEWYSFLKTYDPEGKLSTNDSDIPEIPNRYEYTYECYTTDMVHKLDEIAQRYGLKLLEDRVVFQRYQSHIFLEETGIGSLLWEDSGAKAGAMTGMLYLPGNFSMTLELNPEGMERLYADYVYIRKEYMPQGVPGGGLDLSKYDQWDHTAPDGTTLLLALSPAGHGLILAEQENAGIVISVNGNFTNSLYPDAGEVIQKKDLERIADAFDYSICPGMVDLADVSAKLEKAEEQYQAEHAYVPETYGSFVQYLKEKIRVPDDNLQYTFYDLTGDGEEELLIGHDGAYTEWITLREGETQVQMVQETYLCEGDVEERYTAYEIYESHMYLAPLSKTAVDDIEAERQVLTYLRLDGEQWSQSSQAFSSDRREISEEEARAVMAGYPRVELDWKPLMDYSLDENGTTFRDYLDEKDVRLSGEDLIQRYREWLAEDSDSWHTHCRILDINGDGMEDLLLSGDGEHFWQAVTYRYGSIVALLEADFYLCGNGVLELVSNRWDGGVEMEGHRYIRMTEFGKEEQDFVVYNKAAAAWMASWYDAWITDAEAEEIRGKYERIDQSMMTVEDFLKS